MGKPENPQAFPSEQHETLDGSWNQTFDPGMTLRDWFAGQALATAYDTAVEFDYGPGDTASRILRTAAATAYALADAMLAARALPNPDTEGATS